MAGKCCGCNGDGARCIRCVCVKQRRPCVSCLPMKIGRCQNTLSCRQNVTRSKVDSAAVLTTLAVTTCGSLDSPASSTMQGNLVDSADVLTTSVVPTCGSLDTPASSTTQGNLVSGKSSTYGVELRNKPAGDESCVNVMSISCASDEEEVNAESVRQQSVMTVTESTNVNVDDLMMKAYGETLADSVNDDVMDVWYHRWKAVIQLQGKLYSLPGGSTGRKYVDMLKEEVSHLSVGNYTAVVSGLL